MTGRVPTNTISANRVRSTANIPARRIRPGLSWSGAGGSGGSTPSHTNEFRGSGWTARPAAQFDAPLHWFLDDNETFRITIGADHGDEDWIEYCELIFEGSSRFLTNPTVNPDTGAVGFVFEMRAQDFPVQGSARLHARLRPYNGRDRVIGPITIHRISEASRPIRYVNYSTGNNSNAGSQASPWKNIEHAVATAPAGAIVRLAAGHHPHEGMGSLAPVQEVPVEVRPAVGLTKDDVSIGYAGSESNNTEWRSRAGNVIWKDITVDLSGVRTCWLSANTNRSIWTFKDCAIVDPVSTERDSWPGISDTVQVAIYSGGALGGFSVKWRTAEDQYFAFLECELTMGVATGGSLYRNVTANAYADVIASGKGDKGIFGMVATQPHGEQWNPRSHATREITVATASYNSGTNRTTLTFVEDASGFTQIPTATSDNKIIVLTGSNVGQRFIMASQTSNQIVVIGQVNAVAGDKIRGYGEYHSDFFQTYKHIYDSSSDTPGPENIFFQRIRTHGRFQWLSQSGSAAGLGTISTTGTALTCTVNHLLYTGMTVVAGGYKRGVLEVPNATTAVLDAPFPSNLSSVSWIRGGSCTSFALQLSAIGNNVSGGPAFQFQDGHNGWTIRRCTVDQMQLMFRSDTNDHTTRDFVVADTIAWRASGTVDPYQPVYDRNCHIEVADPVHFANASVGTVTYNGNGSLEPVTGVTRVLDAESVRILPIDIDGSPVTAGVSLIGATG